jgi:hypothetical protein
MNEIHSLRDSRFPLQSSLSKYLSRSAVTALRLPPTHLRLAAGVRYLLFKDFRTNKWMLITASLLGGYSPWERRNAKRIIFCWERRIINSFILCRLSLIQKIISFVPLTYNVHPVLDYNFLSSFFFVLGPRLENAHLYVRDKFLIISLFFFSDRNRISFVFLSVCDSGKRK